MLNPFPVNFMNLINIMFFLTNNAPILTKMIPSTVIMVNYLKFRSALVGDCEYLGSNV